MPFLVSLNNVISCVVKRCVTVNRIRVEQTLENVDTRNWSLFGRTALNSGLESTSHWKLVAQKNSEEKKTKKN